MVKPGDINQQQQLANDAVQAYKDTQAKKAETSKAIEDNATRFAKGGISGGMSTGNKALDTMQQIKREKQPQNSNYDVKYDNKGRIASIIPKNTQSQTMYDRNGNKIIQGNGTFERAQRLAAGQDQQFQNPTGYDVGAVTNQVTQNQSRYNYGNRRFNNALSYLDNTFANKNVTLDDGSSMSAKEYYQKNLDSLIRNTRNPKALMYGLRSLQEDMARRGVGNFDISGELLKGTGMTDRGFAKELWNNRNNFLIQQQGTPKPHNNGTPTPPPPPPPPKPPKVENTYRPDKGGKLDQGLYNHNADRSAYIGARNPVKVNYDPRKQYTDQITQLENELKSGDFLGQELLRHQKEEQLKELKRKQNSYGKQVDAKQLRKQLSDLDYRIRVNQGNSAMSSEDFNKLLAERKTLLQRMKSLGM